MVIHFSMIRVRFYGKIIKLVNFAVPSLWGHFRDGVLEACDEVCGKKGERRSKGDTWWCNEEVKETDSRKKEPAL